MQSNWIKQVKCKHKMHRCSFQFLACVLSHLWERSAIVYKTSGCEFTFSQLHVCQKKKEIFLQKFTDEKNPDLQYLQFSFFFFTKWMC